MTRLDDIAVLFYLFLQIFARRAKIWKNKSLYGRSIERPLLPQANLADDYATA
jgi:hypothetical protein